jgi:hypothetical protein
MGEIHPISMILQYWLYHDLIQFSTKKYDIGLVLKVTGRRIVTRTRTRLYTRTGTKTHALP